MLDESGISKSEMEGIFDLVCIQEGPVAYLIISVQCTFIIWIIGNWIRFGIYYGLRFHSNFRK